MNHHPHTKPHDTLFMNASCVSVSAPLISRDCRYRIEPAREFCPEKLQMSIATASGSPGIEDIDAMPGPSVDLLSGIPELGRVPRAYPQRAEGKPTESHE